MTPKARRLSLAFSVAVGTAILYLPVLRGGFVGWDDAGYVVENFHIRALNLTFLRWAFTTLTEGNWHPLTWISHALDYSLWGLDPRGHHLTNLMSTASGGGSYEICPSCGFQFGVSDDDVGFTYARWRARWKARGLRWSSKSIAPPPGWDAESQMASLRGSSLKNAAKKKRSATSARRIPRG